MDLKLGLNNRHLAIAEHMALHPEHKQYEVAEFFGLTKEFISMLYRTDAFQVVLEGFRKEVFSGDLKQREEVIQEKVYDNLTLALDRVETEFQDPDSFVELKDINRTVEVLASMTNLKRTNRAPAPAPNGSVVNHTMQVQQNILVEAQGYLTGAKPISGNNGSSKIEDVFNSLFSSKEKEKEPVVGQLQVGLGLPD